jgi:RHS repeat-associated protein
VDLDMGFYYNRCRFYDPEMGRNTSQDAGKVDSSGNIIKGA